MTRLLSIFLFALCLLLPGAVSAQTATDTEVRLKTELESLERSHGREDARLLPLLRRLGEYYQAQSRHALALPYFQRGLEISEKTYGAAHPNVAVSLDDLATLYQDMAEFRKALPLYQRSLAIVEKAQGPQHPNVAASLVNLASLYRNTGEYDAALPLYQRSLAIREQALGPDHPDVAAGLNALALLYRDTGEYGAALPLYQRSLAIYEKTLGPSHPSVAGGLSNLAVLYRNMGEYAKALPLLQRSLAIYEQTLGPEHSSVAGTLTNLGVLYRNMGDYGKALPLYQRSLAIVEKALGTQHPAVAGSLGNLAVLYRYMGDYTKALPLLQRSLATYEKALGPDHTNVAGSLNNLALLYWSMDDYQKSLPLYQRSLAIWEKALGPQHPYVANGLVNLASLYRDMREYGKALPLYQRSLAIREKVLGAEHPDVAESLSDLGKLYAMSGEPERALEVLRRAYAIVSAERAPETAWKVQHSMQSVLAQRGQPDAAIYFGKQAVNTIQSIRARASTLDKDLQRSLLNDKRGVYEGLGRVLIDQGRLAEAQLVLAMLKEEEFFDFVRRDATRDARSTEVGYTGTEAAWQERYRSATVQVAALGTEQDALKRKAKVGLNVDEQARLAALEQSMRTARSEFDRFLAELMKDLGKTAAPERNQELGEKNLANLRALQGTLSDLGRRSGGTVVTLHYLVSANTLHIIVTTPQVQFARSSAVAEKTLNRQIAAFREVLQNPAKNPLPLAQELYRLLLGPVAEDLRQTGATTLMVSLDGALRYVPLAALHDGKQFMAETYRIAMFTEAAKDKIKDAPAAQWRIAGLGLTRAVEGMSALPAVKEELMGIVRIQSGTTGILPGEIHLDDAFTAQRMKQSLEYPVLHVASHFVFTPGTESDSFLILGDASKLSLRELKENDFDFRDVDLITLSACETAVGGGKDENGREIEGFGALAQRQGAKGVMATLWPVADSSTGLFMREFYRLRESSKLTKAEAMRQAQVALLKGQVGGASTAAKDTGGIRYAHPFFWAPFILMGNWL